MIGVDELIAARYQMAISLGFHIVLSCFGVALPAMIYVLHRRGIRHDDPVALGLAKKWAKASAVLFAVGAVSGTILSFEMGLLWPGLMSTYGDVIGLPFAMEGIAFFKQNREKTIQILMDKHTKEGKLDRKVADAGGRLYFAKESRMRAELVPVMYPRLDEWRAVRDRLDPDRRITSDLARRLHLLG